MSIDFDLYDKYKKYCKSNGYKMSTRISLLIKNDIKGGKDESTK